MNVAASTGMPFESRRTSVPPAIAELNCVAIQSDQRRVTRWQRNRVDPCDPLVLVDERPVLQGDCGIRQVPDDDDLAARVGPGRVDQRALEIGAAAGDSGDELRDRGESVVGFPSPSVGTHWVWNARNSPTHRSA